MLFERNGYNLLNRIQGSKFPPCIQGNKLGVGTRPMEEKEVVLPKELIPSDLAWAFEDKLCNSCYICHLVGVFDLVKRAMKPTASLWVNIDDTNAGSWGNMSHEPARDWPEGAPPQAFDIGIPRKSLIAIPERFVIGMMNRGWIYREAVIWHKLNVMPASVKDTFTSDFEYFYHFVLSNKDYFWTNERTGQMVGKKPLGTHGEEGTDWEWRPNPKGVMKKRTFWQSHDYFWEQQFEDATSHDYGSKQRDTRETHGEGGGNSGLNAAKEKAREAGGFGHRNMRSVWAISTSGFKGSHFAVYPPKLIEPLILATVPEFICKKCGLPRLKKYTVKDAGEDIKVDMYHTKYSEKETGRTLQGFELSTSTSQERAKSRLDAQKLFPGDERTQQEYINWVHDHGFTSKFVSTGWTTCKCENPEYEPGVVLDPFAGSGTTLAVAKALGRKSIGIELSEKYAGLVVERLKKIQGVRKELELV